MRSYKIIISFRNFKILIFNLIFKTYFSYNNIINNII